MAEARTHLQRDAVEDQIAERDRFPDEERAAVAQQPRDGDPERLHREEEQQAPRADRHHHAVDEARRLAVQPSDGAGRRESVAHLIHDLHERDTAPCTRAGDWQPTRMLTVRCAVAAAPS